MTKQLLIAALVSLSVAFSSSCQKKKVTENSSSTIFTNCKLPIADGYGGAAIGGFPRYADRLTSVGTVNVTFIMVDFSDSIATKTVAEVFSNVANASQFFSDMSYGKLNYNMIAPGTSWVRMPKPSSQYSFTAAGGHLTYITDAIAAATSAGTTFGTTDLVVVIMNPDTSSISPIGPAKLATSGSGITVDGNEILNFVTSGNDYLTHGYLWLNHESTHALGLVDLYDYTPASQTLTDLLPWTGGFGLMGVSSVQAMFAPSLFAWERYVLSWLEDSQVECKNPKSAGEFTSTITPLNSVDGLKAVIVPVGETKVVVVESRRSAGYDSNLTKPGALVYTVDSSIPTGQGPLKVYPAGGTADPWFAQSPRAVGESITVEGIRVEVIASDSSGDTVRISASE